MFHESVLKNEVVSLLLNDTNGTYIDGTLGSGGHAQAILERLSSKGKLVGLDLDEDALAFSRQRLKQYRHQFTAEQQNFSDLQSILEKMGIMQINGILLDLGVSSHQIDTAERGFSYRLEGKLDMRMNPSQELSAREIVNQYPEHTLVDLFKSYGEEKRSRGIAKAIIRERQKIAIKTTTDLKKIISRVLPPHQRVKSLARIFQAIRIEVNQELDNLLKVLRDSLDHLVKGGRIVVISYHSLEDRIVKDFFVEEARTCICPPSFPLCVCEKQERVKILTKRPVRPSEEEVNANPRSRSARLRAAEYILEPGVM